MIIGVDPGINGAIAFLNDDLTLVAVHDMPVMAATKTRKQVNAAELAKIIGKTAQSHVTLATAVVERVGSMPKQGVSGMFSFGQSYGVVLGIFAALMVPVVLITPVAWKKKAQLLGKDKDAARALAQQLYPQAPLAAKKDIGRADAILIGRFGLR